MDKDMSEPTVEDILRMVEAVRSLHNETSRVLNALGREPMPGSQAEAELGSFQESEYVRDVYVQANILIECAADHLMAFTKTVTPPAATIAPWTSIRAVLESGALAAWLIDPSINVTERVQRSLAFRYDGMGQQVKYARLVGWTSVLERVIVHIEDLEQSSIRLGYTPLVDNGKRTGIGQVMPSTAEIIGATLNEEGTYRLSSAMAHTHQWAVSQIGFHRVHGDSLLLREKHLHPVFAAYLCVKGANAFAKPVWQKFCLFGWDTKELKEVFDSAFTNLRSRWVEP